MRGPYLIWLVTVTVGFSVLTGVSSFQRRGQIDDSICALDTTLVRFIDESIASVSLSEAATFPDRYKKGYRLDTALEAQLVNEAPCVIVHTTPPNLLG